MTNKFQHSSKELINLITKIEAMETYMWSSMIDDIKNGINSVDYDDILKRYNDLKDIYDRTKLYHDILGLIKKAN